ncbi:MAG TPA: hypothetical protein VIR26_01210 [Metalysinibacillus sp.]
MFLIAEFKYSGRQSIEGALKFNSKNALIDFVAEKSKSHEEFEVVRINEYKEGNLIPHELTFVKGRIDLVSIPVIGGIE